MRRIGLLSPAGYARQGYTAAREARKSSASVGVGQASAVAVQGHLRPSPESSAGSRAPSRPHSAKGNADDVQGIACESGAPLTASMTPHHGESAGM